MRRLASLDLGVGALGRFAQCRGLAAHEREIAVDPLQLVARRTRSLGSTLGEACGLGGRLARPRELGTDPAALALLLRALARNARGARSELLIAR